MVQLNRPLMKRYQQLMDKHGTQIQDKAYGIGQTLAHHHGPPPEEFMASVDLFERLDTMMMIDFWIAVHDKKVRWTEKLTSMGAIIRAGTANGFLHGWRDRMQELIQRAYPIPPAPKNDPSIR